MADIRLNFEFQGLWLRGFVAPDNSTPRQLISELLLHLNLPGVDYAGEGAAYSLHHADQDLALPEDKTLAELGIRDGDTLRVESPRVAVFLQLLDLNRIEIEALPRHAPVSVVINSLIAKYGLPSRDERRKEGKCYECFSKTAGQILHEGQTLAQARIPPGDTLIITTKEIPGGPEQPIALKQSRARKVKRAVSVWLRGAASRLRRLGSPAGIPLDPVDCSVFAPPTIPRGGSRLIQVHLYRAGDRAYVREVASELDDDATLRSFTSLEVDVARGSNISFYLTMPGVKVSDPMQAVVWRGSFSMVFFAVTVPGDHLPGDVIGTVIICCERVPLGHLKFKMSVTGGGTAVPPLVPAGAVRKYKLAFVSYAWEDRPEVLKRVQMLRVLRIKFFKDILSLSPGARWERELYRHIERSDLFLLFWSSAAERSEWVLKEVRYALRVKGGNEMAPPEIIPVPIEGPPSVPPPEELKDLYFDDYLLFLIASP